MDWEAWLFSWTVAAVTAGGGAYLGAYLRQKAQNFARKENLEDLVSEVKRVTKTTEDIRHEISHEYWNRQRKWELRRDAFLCIAGAIADVANVIAVIYGYMEHGAGPRQSAEKVGELLTVRWLDATHKYDEAQALALVACEQNTCDALYTLREVFTRCVGGLKAGAIPSPELYRELEASYRVALSAVRAELGVLRG